MAHTPGPWTEWGGTEVHFVNMDDPADCVVTSDVRSPDDARLIAAAPELLAALKELVDYDDGSNEPGDFGYDVLQRCKTAIAKAEGRSE